jgi:hypothetical protein
MKHHEHCPEIKFGLKGRGAYVDDQIWQAWKNRSIRFAKPEYPILTVFRAKSMNKLNLKI